MTSSGTRPRFSCWDGTWANAARRGGQQYSLSQVLKEIKEAGYEGVDLEASLAELGSPRDLQVLLAEYGLQLATLVVPTQAQDARERVDYASRFGVTVIMVGGGARPRGKAVGPEDMAVYAAALRDLAGYAASYGMALAQHTHPHSITATTEEALMLLEQVPENVGICADVAHLQQAGSDPVQAIYRLGARLKHVHLKDYRRETDELLELGRGQVDLAGVLRACQDVGYQGWYCVELDESKTTPLESARASRSYLQGLLQ